MTVVWTNADLLNKWLSGWAGISNKQCFGLIETKLGLLEQFREIDSQKNKTNYNRDVNIKLCVINDCLLDVFPDIKFLLQKWGWK